MVATRDYAEEIGDDEYTGPPRDGHQLKGRLNITGVSAEYTGLVQRGGLAPVAYGLFSALAEAGHQSNMIMFMGAELAKSIEAKKIKLQDKGVVTVELDQQLTDFGVSYMKTDEGVNLYILNHGVYASPQKPVYPREIKKPADNAPQDEKDRAEAEQRAENEWYGKVFAAYSKAAAALRLSCPELKGSIVHQHDYHAALTGVYLKEAAVDEKIAVVQTLHNIGYGNAAGGRPFQGVESIDLAKFAGLERCLYDHSGNHEALEYHGDINLLKGGIIKADALNCVSPQYAKEVLTPTFGAGLEGVLNTHRPDGILNGIDDSYKFFRPDVKDTRISPYTVATVDQGKSKNKQILNDVLTRTKGHKVGGNGMAQTMDPLDTSKPLLGIVGRLSMQKHEIMLADNGKFLEDLLKKGNCNVVVIGNNGNVPNEYSRTLERLASMYDNLRWFNNHGENPQVAPDGKSMVYDEHAQILYTAADFLLCPSVYEPCGLTQFQGMLVGTIPIATPVGGLVDSVFETGTHAQNGYMASGISPKAFYAAVDRALADFSNPAKVHALRVQGMSEDHSWKTTLPQYYELYDKAVRHAGLRSIFGALAPAQPAAAQPMPTTGHSQSLPVQPVVTVRRVSPASTPAEPQLVAVAQTGMTLDDRVAPALMGTTPEVTA